jgi:hypothetical protein
MDSVYVPPCLDQLADLRRRRVDAVHTFQHRSDLFDLGVCSPASEHRRRKSLYVVRHLQARDLAQVIRAKRHKWKTGVCASIPRLYRSAGTPRKARIARVPDVTSLQKTSIATIRT